jgi:uncharacterized protein YbbK (DUF523 family)
MFHKRTRQFSPQQIFVLIETEHGKAHKNILINKSVTCGILDVHSGSYECRHLLACSAI